MHALLTVDGLVHCLADTLIFLYKQIQKISSILEWAGTHSDHHPGRCGQKKIVSYDLGVAELGVSVYRALTAFLLCFLLRQDCKLKKVDYSKTPAEFGLTPWCMLMDVIRTKKYQLTPALTLFLFRFKEELERSSWTCPPNKDADAGLERYLEWVILVIIYFCHLHCIFMLSYATIPQCN